MQRKPDPHSSCCAPRLFRLMPNQWVCSRTLGASRRPEGAYGGVFRVLLAVEWWSLQWPVRRPRAVSEPGRREESCADISGTCRLPSCPLGMQGSTLSAGIFPLLRSAKHAHAGLCATRRLAPQRQLRCAVQQQAQETPSTSGRDLLEKKSKLMPPRPRFTAIDFKVDKDSAFIDLELRKIQDEARRPQGRLLPERTTCAMGDGRRPHDRRRA